MKRWWFSWHGPEDDWRAVRWPPPDGWLGYWCSGYDDEGATVVGWAEAESEAGCVALVKASWPEWDGVWRIEPSEKPDPPGSRFPRADGFPEWENR